MFSVLSNIVLLICSTFYISGGDLKHHDPSSKEYIEYEKNCDFSITFLHVYGETLEKFKVYGSDEFTKSNFEKIATSHPDRITNGQDKHTQCSKIEGIFKLMTNVCHPYQETARQCSHEKCLKINTREGICTPVIVIKRIVTVQEANKGSFDVECNPQDTIQTFIEKNFTDKFADKKVTVLLNGKEIQEADLSTKIGLKNLLQVSIQPIDTREKQETPNTSWFLFW